MTNTGGMFIGFRLFLVLIKGFMSLQLHGFLVNCIVFFATPLVFLATPLVFLATPLFSLQRRRYFLPYVGLWVAIKVFVEKMSKFKFSCDE